MNTLQHWASKLLIPIFIVCYFTGFVSAQQQDSINSIKIKVGGITCGMDLKIICSNVMKQNGVKNCESITKAGPTTTFEVKYNPLVISIDSIYKVVEDSPSCDFPDQKPYKVKIRK